MKRNLVIMGLFLLGLAQVVCGTYIVNNIKSIAEGYHYSVQFLSGLILGALPLAIGTAAVAIALCALFAKVCKDDEVKT